MKFTKMHGAGNDYIYINGFKEKIADPGKVSKKLSDRHKGIGSDGLIIILPSKKADFKMKMYNADGSEGRMCGNGIRCVGKYVFDKKMTGKKELGIETKSGIIKLELIVKNKKVSRVKVNMGRPVFEGRRIPVRMNREKVFNHKLKIGKDVFKINCLSMGNPHCVIFTGKITDAMVHEKGPLIEKNSFFPKRVNVEFVKVLGGKKIEMRVWERGSGETMACGTGACAAAVAGFESRKTGRKVAVRTLGGELQIEYSEKGEVFMTGNAVTVFEGEADLND